MSLPSPGTGQPLCRPAERQASLPFSRPGPVSPADMGPSFNRLETVLFKVLKCKLFPCLPHRRRWEAGSRKGVGPGSGPLPQHPPCFAVPPVTDEARCRKDTVQTFSTARAEH